MKQTRVLVECHSLLGDFVLMTPMLKALKLSCPDVIIDVAVASEAERDILYMMGEIANQCYIFNPSKMQRKEILKLIIELRRRQYRYGFVSVNENGRLGSLFLKLVGCKYQIGESSKYFWMDYNRPVKNVTKKHRVDRNISLLKNMGIENPPIISKTLEVNSEIIFSINKYFVERGNKKVISLCLGTGDLVWKEKNGKKVTFNCKKWGYENFIHLTNCLIDAGYFVVWIGGKKEKEELQECPLYQNAYKENIIDLIGKTSISEAIGVLAVSDLVIGGDTGLMHCAAALDRKTLCIIGGTDPEKIRPYSSKGEIVYLGLPCSPCYETEKAAYCRDQKCLKQISIKDVLKKAEKMLESF